MAKKWIKGAIKHPGALTAKAKRAGAMTKRGTISSKWMNEQLANPRVNEQTKRQIRLAKTLKKF